MSRIIALLAGALSLSACSYLPSLEMPTFGSSAGSGGGAQVQIESEPPGAEARAGGGPACRTPCQLTIPDSGLSSVTVSLPGYVPQNVPVRVTRAPQGQFLSESGAPQQNVVVDPNPVFAQLELAPPPPPPPKKKAPPKRKPQAAATPPPPQQPAPAQQQPGFGPPPQAQPGFGPPPQQQGGFGPPPRQQ